ncbi:hypothetical protein Nepgr_003393 [Nepenthes gracilis]|uniref:Eukaryotic translation initiation factor 4B n=1 Tax=Nepenthes gracilis TaxID=150966 RepID=A0AAD3RZE6_NEPGR|nr:hypothetical protein Nepgr_003393 [Nepenthes gracilis]
MSKPWGGIGTWAAEAERAEAEEREQAAAGAPAGGTGSDPRSFPSLKEAVSGKQKKKKMTLSEFTYGVGSGGSARGVGLTPDEMLQLPTGPKQRSQEELYRGDRLGGGFSSYGRSGPPPGRMRDREGDSGASWGSNQRSYGGFDDDRRGPPRRAPDFDVQPSRADEVDNWASAKKSLPPPMTDTGRSNRYGSLGGGSRADDVDNWASGKKTLVPPARSNTFGSGFRDSRFDSDRWRRGDGRENDTGRPRLVLDPPKGNSAVNELPVVKTNKPNPFGEARPREEVLSEKGLDWKKLDLEIDSKKATSRPTSSQGSRPSSAHSSRSESVGMGLPAQGMGLDVGVKTRPKVNPFGDAKPREVLLEQQGKNWRKMDLELEHRGVDRPETEEERALKEEIGQLKKELEKELANDASQASGGDKTSISDLISIKERDLEILTMDLDDKVRFGQKSVERPGSGAGRFASFPERPPSQSGTSEDLRGAEFMDRPRSRGTGDVWTRPNEDRRGGFQGGRDRGFLGSRDYYDRSTSRQRW